MKKFLRPLGVVSLALLLGACTSPYQTQMAALYNSYRAGQVSEDFYRQEMDRLSYHDAAWQNQQANNLAAAAVITGVAAVALDGHHHHHHHGHHHHH